MLWDFRSENISRIKLHFAFLSAFLVMIPQKWSSHDKTRNVTYLTWEGQVVQMKFKELCMSDLLATFNDDLCIVFGLNLMVSNASYFYNFLQSAIPSIFLKKADLLHVDLQSPDGQLDKKWPTLSLCVVTFLLTDEEVPGFGLLNTTRKVNITFLSKLFLLNHLGKSQHSAQASIWKLTFYLRGVP